MRHCDIIGDLSLKVKKRASTWPGLLRLDIDPKDSWPTAEMLACPLFTATLSQHQGYGINPDAHPDELNG